MKKFLLPLLAILLWGCNLDGSYYAENARDIVTVAKDGHLYSDNGASYTVTDYGSVDKELLQEGNRLFMVFDILNQNLDVKLKNINQMVFTEATPFDEEEELPHDPLVMYINRLGPKYLDLGFTFFKKPGTTCQHTITFRYSVDSALQKLTLTAVHDGAGEDPSKEKESDLSTETRFFSIPLESFGEITMVDLVMDILVTDANGKYAVQSYTYSSY